MTRVLYITSIVVGTPLLAYGYYTLALDLEVDRTFLSVSTFLFSIFAGFFISRQASRFNRVRESVTAFDGKLSSVYRASGHVSEALQKAVGKVITKRYQKLLSGSDWHTPFTEKSTTLRDIHALLEKHVVEDEVTKLSNQALGGMVKGLANCQDLRKQMIALYEERIPKEQWVMILFIVSMLVTTVSALPSTGELFVSILKAAFVVSVFSVMFILYKLNNLSYTERLMGEHSAEDVLNLIKGSK